MFGWLKRNRAQSEDQAAAEPGSRKHAEEMLRQVEAQAYEAYKLARRDMPREHYQPFAYSGDSAILSSQDLMNRRTRDLVRNTPQGKVIRSKLVNLVVGKGFKTFAWPFRPDEMLEMVTELRTIAAGEIGPRLRYALESDDLFDEYQLDRKQFDAENRLSGPEMMRMAMGETVITGNGIMVRVFRREFDPDKHLVPLCWQMFEREQLDTSKDREAGTSSRGRQANKIVGGIEINSRNQAVAYHLYLNHPDDFFGVSSNLSGTGASTPGSRTRSVRVPAERVIDLALYDRPSSSLGATWLDAPGQPIWDRDSYCESEIRTAAVESVFAYVAKLKGASTYGGDWGFGDGNEASDEYGNRKFKVGYSPVASVIEPDESLDMVKPQRPNKDADSFLKVLDRDIAAATGLSYYSLTGDWANTSFTSGRAAKMDEDLNIGPLQQWFGLNCAIPIRSQFNAIAAASGRLRSITPRQFQSDRRLYQRFDTIGPGRELLEPFKEGEARTGRLRTGIATFKDECAARNLHWIKQIIQLAFEKQVFRIFDVQPDFSKPGNLTEENAEEAADEVMSMLGIK